MAEAATFAPPPLAGRALVPTARLLLLVNSLLLALAGWLLLPLDVATPTLAHAAYTAWTFLVVTALVALPLGGWKALCLALRWRVDGSLVWAWGWLAVYAAFGTYCAYGSARLV